VAIERGPRVYCDWTVPVSLVLESDLPAFDKIHLTRV